MAAVLPQLMVQVELQPGVVEWAVLPQLVGMCGQVSAVGEFER